MGHIRRVCNGRRTKKIEESKHHIDGERREGEGENRNLHRSTPLGHLSKSFHQLLRLRLEVLCSPPNEPS